MISYIADQRKTDRRQTGARESARRVESLHVAVCVCLAVCECVE